MHTLRIMLLLAAPCLLAQEMLKNGDFKKGLSGLQVSFGPLKGPVVERLASFIIEFLQGFATQLK